MFILRRDFYEIYHANSQQNDDIFSDMSSF